MAALERLLQVRLAYNRCVIDRDDSSPRRLLDYHQAEESAGWSMLALTRWIGWCSFGFSLLLFIDPYLPNLHPLMLLPIFSAMAALSLGVLSAQQRGRRRASLVAMVPGLLALLIPAVAMFVRWALPVVRK